MIELGWKVKDSITGMTGIATARAVFLFGCSRILVEPDKVGKDGKLLDTVWFDEQRIIVVKKQTITVSAHNQATTGGPQKDPPVSRRTAQ